MAMPLVLVALVVWLGRRPPPRADRVAVLYTLFALAFIAQRTVPGDYVAVLPEGTSLLFLAGRRNPLREEIVTPGFLDAAGEARAIAALEHSDTRLVLLVNRATREFGAEAFGRDYCQTLMAWIVARYQPCATFGAQDPRLRVGDKPFFVRAYCR
jgi:hypothetical protein